MGKVLERLDIFKKLRQEIVSHSHLDERLLLALDNQDLPEWWIPGKHDRDLLFGVAKHGIIRMEFHILNDQELSFQDIMKRHLSGEKMVDAKEKRLYEEMRLNAANARKELVKDEKEEVKKSKEERQEDETSESKKDTTEEKPDEVTKEENIESDTKQDEVKEEDKEDKVTTEKLESLETD